MDPPESMATMVEGPEQNLNVPGCGKYAFMYIANQDPGDLQLFTWQVHARMTEASCCMS